MHQKTRHLGGGLEKAGVLLKPNALVDKESVLSKKGQTKLKEALEEYKGGKVKSLKEGSRFNWRAQFMNLVRTDLFKKDF